MHPSTHFMEDYCWSQRVDVTMKDFSAFLDMRRCKKWAHKIFSSEDLFCQFSQSAECLTPDLHPELLSGGVQGQQLQWLMLQPTQRQMASANFQCTVTAHRRHPTHLCHGLEADFATTRVCSFTTGLLNFVVPSFSLVLRENSFTSHSRYLKP